jgi:hypothetical protein
VSSRKPQGKVERLPVDYAEPRKQPLVEQHTDYGSALTLAPLTETERQSRKDRALAVLESFRALDLADALGLSEPPAHPAPVLIGTTAVPCPQCGKAAGIVCSSKAGGAYKHGHQARRLLAQELREAAA